jgi:Protein of unknown function (DUF3108)
MPSRLLAALVVAAAPAFGAAAAALAQPSTEPPVPAFSAHYTADWKSINVGTSDLELKPDGPSKYLYTWTITARGIFRLIYSNDVVQKSWLSVVGNHVRPDRYRAGDGNSTVSIDFDWDAMHASGTSETKPVALNLTDGTQDVMSIQVEIMLDLRNGKVPGTFHILDKNEIKEFIYSEEGPARLRTPLGELDTVVVSSRRAGNNRLLRMWFAPSLGYVPVQAERSRDGKLEFAIRIKSLTR